MSKQSILACFLVIAGLTAQQPAKPERQGCKTGSYNNDRPSLTGLALTPQEKKEITTLAKRGRKIDAIRIMRRCSDMSLKEQKVIVDSLFSNY